MSDQTKQALMDVAQILDRAGWTKAGDHDIRAGGNVGNGQIGQTLANAANIIEQQAPGERKELLNRLRRDVDELIQRLPDDRKDEAPSVADNLEILIKQATSTRPNRKWYLLSAEGLLDASKWVKDFTGNIAGTISQLGQLVFGDFSLPKID